MDCIQFREKILWLPKIQGLLFQLFFLIMIGLNSSNSVFYLQRNERDGCGFIHWIDPPSGERHNCDNGLFKRVEEIKGNLLQQQIFVEKRDEQVGKFLMLMDDVKTGLCIFVVLLSFVLYLALW